MERDQLTEFLAQGLSLEQIGERVGRHPSTVAYWLKRHGLEAVHRSRHLRRGGIERDTLEALVATGASSRQMANSCGVSLATVRYWLTRYGLRTAATKRRRQLQAGRREQRGAVDMECPRHGTTKFMVDATGRYRCVVCRSARVVARRKRLKAILVQEAGGRCFLCGYSRYFGALHFHHVDPAKKGFNLGERGLTRSLDRCRKEAEKCVLLCATCHAEVESGVVSVPVQLASAARV